MENEIIKERFLGTIFGQAVGDALGLSTEFMSKQEVDRFYPNGIEDYSQIVQDDHRRRWQRGDWTDDTDMMLCILDSFVACQKVDILDIARRFNATLEPIYKEIFSVGFEIEKLVEARELLLPHLMLHDFSSR